MEKRSIGSVRQVAMVVVIFAFGYACGSLGHGRAEAQVGGVASEVLKQAGGAGGSVGAVANMGASLVEMEQHVSGLQKNLDALKKVKAALGG